MIGFDSAALWPRLGYPAGLSTPPDSAVSRAAQSELAPSAVNPAAENGMRQGSPVSTVPPVAAAGASEPLNPYGVREFPFIADGFSPEELAGRGRVMGDEKAESPQEVMEASECQTCKNRRYQDGSDDPGVSFKTPTRVDPSTAASAVRGHEQEHVVREQAKARREDRKVVSQSVTYHTSICPECGRIYVSGGTTRTVTAPDKDKEAGENSKNAEERKTEPALETDTENF